MTKPLVIAGLTRRGFSYALPLRCLSASHWPFDSLRRNGVDARIKSGHDEERAKHDQNGAWRALSYFARRFTA